MAAICWECECPLDGNTELALCPKCKEEEMTSIERGHEVNQRVMQMCRQCNGDACTVAIVRNGEKVYERRCQNCGLAFDEPRASEVKCQCGIIHHASLPCPRCKDEVKPEESRPDVTKTKSETVASAVAESRRKKAS